MNFIKGDIKGFWIGLSDNDLEVGIEGNLKELERVLSKDVKLYKHSLVEVVVSVRGLLYNLTVYETILILKLR